MWNTLARRCSRALTCSVVLTLALSCTSGEQSVGAPVADEEPPVDACSLLSAGEIHRITDWDVSEGTDHSDAARSGTRSVCSFSEARHAGAVQVQWSPDGGSAEFDRSRSAMEAAGMDGRDVEVPGASAAYDSPAHGVVGMLVDGSFVQVVTIGPAVDDDQHLELAAVAAGNLR